MIVSDGEIAAESRHIFSMTDRVVARFGQLMLQKGRWAGAAIVSEDWVEESTRSYSSARGGEGTGYSW